MKRIHYHHSNLDYERILKRSWNITKTYKVLWVFGMALATFSSGGSNYNFSGGGSGGGESSGTDFKFPQEFKIDEIPETTSKVLGAATDRITDVVSNIPVSVWIILGISIVVAIIAAIILSLFLREWARGALIASIHDIEDNNTISLRSGAKHGLSSVKRLMLLHFFPGFLFGLVILLISGLFYIGFLIFENVGLKIALGILAIFTAVLVIVVGGILLALATIAAEQLIVRKNLSFTTAFRQGLTLAKKYAFKMFGLAAIHLGFGCAIGCVTVIIIGLLGIIITFAFVIGKEIGIVIAVLVGIPLLVLFMLSVLIKGVFLVFKTSNWTLFIREIDGIESNNKPAEKEPEK